MSAIIRKIVTVVEETHLEMGQAITPPTRRAAAIAVIENPFAGRYVEDLSPLIAIGEELGELLSKRAVAALGIDGASAQSYGKAAAVGDFRAASIMSDKYCSGCSEPFAGDFMRAVREKASRSDAM